MASQLLHPDLKYNRAAIMRSAWASARADHARNARYGTPSTLRACLADALRSKWDLANGLKATALWRIERDAEARRRLTLAPLEREVLDLRDARVIARHIDHTPTMHREVAAIDARLAQLSA